MTKQVQQSITPTHVIGSTGTADTSDLGYRALDDFKDDLGLGTSLTQTANNGNGTAAAPAFTFTGDDNTGIIRAAADELGFVTNGSEKVRIDDNGNVGIGTTTPGARLQIDGAVFHNTGFAVFNTGVDQYEDFEFARFNVGAVSTFAQDSFSGTVTFHVTAFRGASTNHQSTRAVQYFVTLGSFPNSISTSQGRAELSLVSSNRTEVGVTPGSLDVAIVAEGSTDGGSTWTALGESTGISITANSLIRLRANLTGSTPNSFAGRFRAMTSISGCAQGNCTFNSNTISII
jgi:hypothetical protein